ncbi:hypothetical protein K1T71_004391 [Dendrolimus kikuchii]|uniref:Uncharacterized protein n=1 Tax=Dendrolimus kikuchii TaxID=765133 RepID=A0ACC1D7I9_9NEOP|nr:hypothetical protein K1T71_004391 [Dendrolimus kikuchii]
MNKERRQLLMQLSRTGKQVTIMETEDLIKLTKLSDNEDEIINDIMDDLGIEILNKNKFQADQIMPIPSTSTPTLTHPRSQSEVIHPDGTDYDNIERMSITPTPSVYNSFASSPSSPAHDLLEPNQTHQSVNSGNNAITSVVNCQSPIITTTDASYAVEASSECYTPPIINGRKRRQFSIDRSKRKRLRNKDKRIDTKRKLLLNSGKQHLSRNGKMQLAKCIKPPCDVCKFKCCSKISISSSKKKYFRSILGVTYTLPVGLDKSSPRSVKVCKAMFKITLSISNQCILSLDKYDKNTGNCSKDLRGHHDSKNKINTAAPVESHYIRKDSNKLYLSRDLNFSIMFKLYQAWTEENNVSERVLTVRQYLDIVNRDMNICFFIPKQDQCDFNQHMKNKDVARFLKKQDKIQATGHPDTVTSATFDFQKFLSTPHGETSYYKRKLSIFNFTVFEMALKKGICYMWPETTTKRGSNEVASCLLQFIEISARKGIKDVCLWSDNCGAQNRNRARVFYVRVRCVEVPN